MIIKILKKTFRLFFPDYCPICDTIKPSGSPVVCFDCASILPLTNSWYHNDTEFMKKVEGKCVILHCASLFFYENENVAQKIIHEIKYRNGKDIGYQFGLYFGEKLVDVPHFVGMDYIIPLPLHPKKESKRGYNQSYWIAKGISEILRVEICLDAVLRVVNNPSQTTVVSKNRPDNVKGIFRVADKDKLQGKRILIVDDVATTGSTLSSIVNEINDTVPDCIVSVVVLSSTHNVSSRNL